MSSLAKRMPMDGRAGQARWAEAGQARRIHKALQRQRARRRDLTAHARRLAAGQLQGNRAHVGLVAGATSSSSSLSMEIDADVRVGNEKAPRRNRRGKRHANQRSVERQLYSDQLAHHEWMVHIPRYLTGRKTATLMATPGGANAGSPPACPALISSSDPIVAEQLDGADCADSAEVEEGWFVAPRPEGRRCLVIAAGGKTIVRDKNGSLMATFQSMLPNGARSCLRGNGHSFGDGGSILDCILQERETMPTEVDEEESFMSDGAANSGDTTGQAVVRTYWVLDVMCWKGYSLYDCDASFRAYWLETKLSELGHVDSTTAREKNRPRFLAVPRFDCDADGLARAYDSRNFEFQMDGLLFINRAGHYAPGPTPTPLTLIWKDAACAAPYFTSHYRAAATASGGASCGNTENDLCGLLEGLNVHSSEPVLLRVLRNSGGQDSGEHGGRQALLHAAKGGTFDGECGGRYSTSCLITQGGIVLGTAQSDLYEHGRILKFAIDGIAFDAQTGEPSLLNPRFLGMAPKTKLKAHSLSRISFHHRGARVPSHSDLMREVCQGCGIGDSTEEM